MHSNVLPSRCSMHPWTTECLVCWGNWGSLRTLCADFHHWKSSFAVGESCWLKYWNPNVERCNVGLRGCAAVPEEPFSLWTQRDQAGSATYEHILLGLAGMSNFSAWFCDIDPDLEGNQVELVSQKKEFLFWDQPLISIRRPKTGESREWVAGRETGPRVVESGKANSGFNAPNFSRNCTCLFGCLSRRPWLRRKNVIVVTHIDNNQLWSP